MADEPQVIAEESDETQATPTQDASSDVGNSSSDNTPPKPTGRRKVTNIREWLLPRSVVGLVAMVLAFSMGASIAGVAFYAFYQYQQTQTTKKVDSYIKGFDERYRTASDSIDNEKQNAQASIQQELAPLIQASGGGVTFGQMADRVKDSVWFVQTQDSKGAPSVGSAFVVQSSEKNSLLVTSYSVVQASTAAPGPGLQLTKGNEKINAKLLNWVEDQDLAVISIDKGNIPALKFVPDGKLPRVGDRVFAASGLGGAGASVSQGYVNDASSGVIQHSAPLGVAYRGGPLLDSEGRVVGTTSMTFSPLGFASPEGITFSLPVRDTCSKLLTCPNDNNSASGARTR